MILKHGNFSGLEKRKQFSGYGAFVPGIEISHMQL